MHYIMNYWHFSHDTYEEREASVIAVLVADKENKHKESAVLDRWRMSQVPWNDDHKTCKRGINKQRGIDK